MPYQTPQPNSPAAFSSGGWKQFFQRNIIAPLQRQRRRRAAIADLEAMTDHLLADLGISRDDIPDVVEGLMSRDALPAAPRPPAAAAEARRDPEPLAA